MIYIDIHTHTSKNDNEIISIKNIFHSQTSEIVSKPDCFYSIGIHPWHTKEVQRSDVDIIVNLSENKKVAAIGECGIDKIRGAEIDKQIEIFKAQSTVADKANKPLIIHCVRAYDKIVALHKQLKPSVPWIIHDFRKNLQLAQQMVKLGFKLSFGRIIKYNKESFKELLLNLPENSYFFETDDTEEDIKELYKISAEIKNTTVEAIAKKVRINFEEIFRVKINA